MDRHQQLMTLTAAAVLVPLVAACGNEKAGSGSVGAEKPLTGVVWSVDSVTVDGTTHRAPADAHVTIGGDGRAEGSYGCNTFSAKAALDGDTVRLSDATATEMACGKKPMDFERALARTLTGAALSTDLNSDRLTLTAGDGDTVRLSKSQDAPLHGTKWTVTGPGTAGEAHLTFDTKKGTVSGRLGCNHVNAKATVRDGSITVGAPTTTRMMCEDSLMDTERALLRALKGPLTYEIDHRTITLTSDNGTSVRAVAAR
ncbi:META domain-containing protein [Streptomyces sp. DH24]|uniref:META domain-containing protein n=1 Tax=Streptomyces sp. DH24 TaxID=3040123 RepID=UPI0024424BC1|nr:META domain-containing protein [Streptomyces sp. DH24]MDG9719932.1 META domain-containing protein [Streptomyces sp. DH24]